MKLLRLISCFIFFLFAQNILAQEYPRPVALSTATGWTVDAAEKEKFGILTFWKKENFDSAQCFVRADSSFFIRGWMKNDSVVDLNCSRKEFYEIAWTVNYRAGIIKDQPIDWFGFLLQLSVAIIEHPPDNCRKK